jgi:DNA ligase-1
MKKFAQLFEKLDATNSTKEKKNILVEYYSSASPNDIAWAVFFLTGQKLKRLIKSRDLRTWALEKSKLPDWLFEECYAAVGDMAETISLLCSDPNQEGSENFRDLSFTEWIVNFFMPLAKKNPDEQKVDMLKWWSELTMQEILVVNKLVTGSFRIGVSRVIVENSLGQWLNISPSIIAHRLMGEWQPSDGFVNSLTSKNLQDDHFSQPYPFYLASPLEFEKEKMNEELGEPTDWVIEWKWDGIRAQVVRRKDKCFIWSRGEELISDNFIEITTAARYLEPGTVIDGELVAYKDGKVLPFSSLQRRISRKKLSPKILKDIPVKFIAFDCLEDKGEDIRNLSLDARRLRLLEHVNKISDYFLLSQQHALTSWDEAAKLREKSRDTFVEGLMLKRRHSVYKVGRKKGDWWKWKIDPFSVDAVLIYAQVGHGRRANLFTDYTFAVWRENELVPIAKAYSGLDNAEIGELDQWIRSHTKERFGPIRSVTPHFVFELGFEGIAESTRHKSGVALRFPRILRWRKDKLMKEADHLESLQKLIYAQPT